ncbi:MAG: phosphatidylcholine/phosphatidylserine synthase [Sedimentisphaerales bacterium]|nr:phosphatidylcholine/phosphatidylserine synthase [Sedimentisphaerales bacterium]
MPRFKNKTPRKNLFRRVRRPTLKHITILPSLVTILNGVCGFAAIAFAGKGATLGPGGSSYFALSGYMVLLAMIADMLDGRLARMNQSTSSFGGQLDSLCDMVSFGVAPAFLMLKVLEYKVSGFEALNPAAVTFLERFIWAAAAGYISCAAIRLARFNVENEEDESAHMSFVGLPTPAAAGVIVSLVILHQEILPGLNIVIYILPFCALGSAVLMVSRIQYPHVLNQYLRGKKPFSYLIRVLLLSAFIYWTNIQAAMVLIFCGFAASSFVKWLYYKISHKKPQIITEALRRSAQGHPALTTNTDTEHITESEEIE